MDFSRIYQLHKFLLNHRYPVPLNDILNELEYSKATFHRVCREMRDYLGAPIINRKGEGYLYSLSSDEQYELPGLWFSSKELVSLSLLEQLTHSFQPELVNQLLTPFQERITHLLSQQNISQADWTSRINVISQLQRPCEPKHFSETAYALLHREQLEIDYLNRDKNEITRRNISPQRLVYYRDNWYLDAWCHLREGLRTFSVDAIQQTQQNNNKAINVDENRLDTHFAKGYGIFSGAVIGHAQLKFSSKISSRVSQEKWHPKQRAKWTADNEYLLIIPYSNTRELLGDILSYGQEIEVMAPETLRNEVKKALSKALNKYI